MRPTIWSVLGLDLDGSIRAAQALKTLFFPSAFLIASLEQAPTFKTSSLGPSVLRAVLFALPTALASVWNS
jgi:hypothetical protein